MRCPIILFLILCSIVSANSQTISMKMDSITSSELARLSSNKNSHYDSILYNRAIHGMYQRLDTLDYDYVFVTENSYKEGTYFSFEETYIYKKDSLYYSFTIQSCDFDSMPSAEYIIGSRETSNIPMDTEWLFSLLKSYQETKPFQKVKYDKIQKREIFNLDHFFFDRKLYHWYVKREIKNTWQIQSFIQKENEDVKVSIQSPPKHPRFKVKNELHIVDF